MELEFEKWHGNKNDFILLWFNHDQVVFDSLRRQATSLCSRDGSGIGADGILVMHTHLQNDLEAYKLSIINSDGSIAETCGNGIRCAALSTLHRFRTTEKKVELPEAIEIQLESSQVTCRFLGSLFAGRQVTWPLVAVTMGHPEINQDLDDYKAAGELIRERATTLGMDELTRDWSLVTISNRHIIFYLDKVHREAIRKIGPAFQSSPLWDGINVHIVASKPVQDADRRQSAQILGQPIEELFEVFVWERGAGETQACGSGASAVGAAAFASGLVDRSHWLGIDMPGGRLYVQQKDAAAPVTLAGPGQFVFRGRLMI